MYKMKFIKNTKSLKNIQKLPEKIRKYQKKIYTETKKIKKITDTDYPPYLKKSIPYKTANRFFVKNSKRDKSLSIISAEKHPLKKHDHHS